MSATLEWQDMQVLTKDDDHIRSVEVKGFANTLFKNRKSARTTVSPKVTVNHRIYDLKMAEFEFLPLKQRDKVKNPLPKR